MRNSVKGGLFHVWLVVVGVGLWGSFLVPHTALAATYYVATTGNDANPGTSALPWRHPQRCTTAPVTAGDTCLVRNGTYTDTDGNGVTVYVRTTSPAGTVSQPITIKSEVLHGATITVPSKLDASNTGIYVSRPYYVIQGFKITGGTATGNTQLAYSGVTFTAGATGGVARSNWIHQIGRTVCSNSAFGFAGVLLQGVSSVWIEQNLIHTIGRLRNGESGCSTDKFHHDHGIYSEGASNVTIRRNVIYDTNRGYPLHIYKSQQQGAPPVTHTNISVYHNTISGKSPTGSPAGQIILCNTLQTVQIKNNIFHDPPQGYVVNYCPATIASSVVISYNLTNSTRSDFQNPISKPASGITYTNNFTNTNPGFVNAGTFDFRLTATSPAINKGTAVGVPAVPDGQPDIGRYEFGQPTTLAAPMAPIGIQPQ